MSTKKIRCPQCQQETFYSDQNAFRPFCSERCKILDLGAWATENYRLPEQEKNASSHKIEDENLSSSESNSDKNNLH